MKRINHTKQLAQDFSQLSGRLERIDETLAQINSRLGSTSSTIYSSSASTCTDEYADRWPSDRLDAKVIAPTQRAVHIHMVDEHGIEHYHGPTSLQALMQRTQTSLASRHDQTTSSRVTSSNTIVQDALSVISQGFPSPVGKFSIERSSSRVTRIPYNLAVDALESYLSADNLITPIFDADLIRQAVNDYYDINNTQSNETLNLCLSAMAALTLPAQIPVQDASLSITFGKLLENCLRAVDSPLLDEARVANAQASYLLAFILGEHSAGDQFERAISRATCLIRLFGIEHDTGNHNDHVKHVVYWALFALDKQRTFLTGKACELHLAECDLAVPWTIAESADHAVYVAKAHLFMSYEEVWAALYCARAWRASPQERQIIVMQLDLKLKTWYERHKDFLNDARASQSITLPTISLKLELQYCFHIAQLLVHRLGVTMANTQTQNNSARAALQIIVSAASRPEAARVALLKRIIRCNTPLAFFDLHYYHLSRQGSAATKDLELLLQTYLIVQSLAQERLTEDNYFAYLATSMHWCLSVNKVMVCASGARIPQCLSRIPPDIPASYRGREGKLSMAPSAYQEPELVPDAQSGSQVATADLNWVIDAMTSQYNAFLDINTLSTNAADMSMMSQADLLHTQTSLQPSVLPTITSQAVRSISSINHLPPLFFDEEGLDDALDEDNES